MSAKALYNRGIFKGTALKFSFFLVSFSFGNERKRSSARRARPPVCGGERKRGTAKAAFTTAREIRSHRKLLLRLARFAGARQHFIADEICHTSRSDVLLRGAMCYFAERCVTSRSDVLLRGAMCYIHRLRGPPSPRNTVIFDQVRKALLRIEI